MNRKVVCALAGVAVLSFSAPSFAQAVAPSPATEAEKDERRWYGWQTLIVDGASTVEVVATLSTDQPLGAVFGAGGFVLGGPIVHLLHERPSIAALSLGLRVGLPLLTTAAGMLIGAATERPCTPSSDHACSGGGLGDPSVSSLLGGAVGLIVGTVSASAIDISVLSTETTHRPAQALAIGVRPTRGGATLSASLPW